MDRVEYQPLMVQDLINLNRQGELNLEPWYQRRSVWTTPQKAYLINTILEQKPVPSLYIRHSLDVEKEKSVKEVVDGQQRIRSILEFANGVRWTPKTGPLVKMDFRWSAGEDKADYESKTQTA